MQPNSDGVTNLFVSRSAAQRYAAARPYFHPLVAKKIAVFTGVPRFGRAVDVACGTGQSARALTEIADRVEAIDISADMIAEALPSERVHYQVAPAEAMPFDNASIDIATVGLAFHWFDQAAFLREARRVLKPSGWIVVYNSGFGGEMAEDPTFRTWARETYQGKFPTPPRRALAVSAEMVAPYGFELAGTEKFAHEETMSAEQLTRYLTTQTNVIAAVESGTTPLADAAAWIAEGVGPYFNGGTRTLQFGGAIWYLKNAAPTRSEQ